MFRSSAYDKFPWNVCNSDPVWNIASNHSITLFRVIHFFCPLWHSLMAEELAKFHEASRGSELYVDKSCGPGDLNWMDPITRNTISSLKELEAKGEDSDM